MHFIRSPLGLIVVLIVLFILYSQWRRGMGYAGNEGLVTHGTDYYYKVSPQATGSPLVQTSVGQEGYAR